VDYTLCDYEVKVLRLCAGQDVPDLQWGAAMSVALESLKGFGLVDCTNGAYRATKTGLNQLKLFSKEES
jgi:hypothetical protein